jgi:TRAP-type C4-dicarboxylate transport system permease small subunit
MQPEITPRHDPEPNNSVKSVMSNVLLHLHQLVRKEMQLFKAEVAHNLKRLGLAVGLLAGAGIILLVGLNVLAGAGVAALVELGLAPGWAALAVTGIAVLIALILYARGMNIIKNTSLAPTETTEMLKRDAERLKETIHDA